MQAALMLRSKQRVARRRKLKKLGRLACLPSNVATKEIPPWPPYPPESWDRQMTLSLSINGVQQLLFLTENGLKMERVRPKTHSKCAQGRAAWLERGRRCSVQDNNPASCHRRWVKRNRIHDSSLGGSSDDEDLLGVLRGPSSFANAFLYVGLGTIAIGLVIAFVGTGEKGFKTVELRLIGPSLIGIGLICCILRICFCICPSHCISSSRRARKKNNNKIDADHTTSLLRGESKRVSIAKGPHLQKIPLTHRRSNNKMLNEGMEALRQIATTSLFLQNEQKPSTNRVVPIIKEPEKAAEEDAPLEMKKLDTTLNITDVSDDDDDDDDEEIETAASNFYNQTESLVQSQGKLARQRLSVNKQKQQQQQQQQQQQDTDSLLMETSLMVISPTTSILTSTSPLPSTSKALLSSSSSTSYMHTNNYDLPSSIPHRYPAKSSTSSATIEIVTANEQHTPGQIIETGASSTSSTSIETIRSKRQKQQTPSSLSVPGPSCSSSSSSNQSHHNHHQYHNPVTTTATATINNNHQSNLLTSTSSNSTIATLTSTSTSPSSHYSLALSPPPPTIHSEPELVLSPAKLGQ